jgi:hypothetical protein
MSLPTAIFERDIRPHVSVFPRNHYAMLKLIFLPFSDYQSDGYVKQDYKQCAIRSDGVV